MSDLSAILAKRDQVGAASLFGRRLTVIAQIVQVRPIDDDHARRQRGILIQAERGLRAIVDADRVGAA